MRRNFVILSCVVICLVGILLGFLTWEMAKKGAGTKQPEQGGVRLLVEDIANVAPKSRTKRNIAIKNDSLTPWTVGDIRSDCGCAVYKMEPARLESGAIGTLSLEYTAPNDAGTINQKVLVLFREEQAPTIVCLITGFVEPWCYAIPKEVDFGSLAVDKGKEMPTRTVVLRIKPGNAIDWERSPIAPDWLRVKVVEPPNRKENEGEQGKSVRIQVTPAFPKHTELNDFVGTITFESVEGPEKKLVVLARASIEPLLSAFPTFLSLGTREVGEKVTKKILLQGRYLSRDVDQSFIRKNIHVRHNLPNQLAVETIPGKKPGQVDIECRFTIPEFPPFLMGEIIVSCEGKDVITIPITSRIDSLKAKEE